MEASVSWPRMTDAPAPPPSPNVSALVEALDARARQAGSEGAASLVRGMLGTVAETLGTVEERLERIESQVTGAAGDNSVVDAVQSSLSAFNTRLGRLEEAFVQAVEESGSGTQAVVDQIRQVVASSLPQQSPSASELLGPVLDALTNRLDRLEAAFDRRMTALEERPAPEFPPFPEFPEFPEMPPPAAPVDLQPVLDRLDAIERRPMPEPPSFPDIDVRGPVADALAPLLERIGQVEEQLTRLADAPPPEPPAPPLDPSLVDRLDQAATVLARDERGAKLIALVEERIAAVVRAVAERADAARNDVATLRDEQAALAKQLDDVRAAARAATDAVVQGFDRSGRDVQQSLDRSTEEVQRSTEELRRELRATSDKVAASVADSMAPVAGVATQLEELRDRLGELDARVMAAGDASVVVDALRREAELLTQRVAALAVGVEATRSMVEHLADASEASLGRRAGEVGRRLAHDLGLRPRRPAPRRERELGRGAGDVSGDVP